MTNLSGKTALVTGSTSGIGLAIAEKLAEQGCNIILHGLGGVMEVEAIRQKIADTYKVEVIFHGADLKEPAQIENMFGEIKEVFGGVDILVNNAGIQFVAPIDEFPTDKWHDIIAINLTASFHTISKSLPYMKEKTWGRIINIASAHALVASPYKSAYVAAKHGIAGLTKTVALEVAEQGISCNAICPGYVWTPLVEGQVADTAKARNISEDEVINDVMLKAQPTKKFVKTDEIADMVLFLCQDAAQNITGTTMPIDGGWSAQ